ncbi:Mrp/NBP35 family ATP-binding protein [Pacificimonas flava]|uniref:Iron-sulfur cluster carrier protein n=1 Tax=Pacificimonas flava TaxID=1234595 RepID=M2T7G0_9SPHN|nr:Mrp/NBP35 family ATP-binding protein [Pacificimonas flava]EMD82459.1 Scaffold protein for [4Fe-4S] cluster assembly ApbC [Pacificimonas flava]MBB5281291.1 ATP-binding protein involved in chromosome partitioning [Pacificimonas flava]
MNEDELRAALAKIDDPAGSGDLISSGRASGIVARAETRGFVLDLGGLSAEAAAKLKRAVELAAPGARIITTSEAPPPKPPAPPRQPHEQPAPDLSHLGRIVAVASGKGGVGKSTVAANLAVALAQSGLRVGLLDCDIYGPSVPTLLGAKARASGQQGRIEPLEAHGLKLLSIANLTPPDQAVIWRGPMAAAAMMQMLTDGDWGTLDVMILDMPPGTGDIQLSLAQKVKPAGAVIVSTPQDLALIDAEKAIAMFAKVDVPVLGLIENMSTFVCPHCGERSDIFGHGGAKETSAARRIPFLGAVPLTMALRAASDAGTPAVYSDGEAGDALRQAAAALREKLEEPDHAADE